MSNPDEITELLQRFVDAATWADARALVERQPEQLLAIEAARLLDDQTQGHSPGTEAYDLLQNCSLILARCRSDGIASAFADRILVPDLKAVLAQLRSPHMAPEHERRIGLAEEGLRLAPRRGNPRIWAILQVYLGNAHVQLRDAWHMDHEAPAIAAYECALEVLESEGMLQEQGAVRRNLGILYLYAHDGPTGQGIEEAIHQLGRALDLTPRDRAPDAWASVAHTLGCAWRERPSGRRDENLRQAIACFEQSLEVRTRERALDPWAYTCNELAATLMQCRQGAHGDNQARAGELLKSIVASPLRDEDPVLWAQSKANLGIIHYRRHGAGEEGALEQAIVCLEGVLPILVDSPDPADRLHTLANLGNAYAERRVGDRLENLIRAEGLLREALDERDGPPQPAGLRATTRLNLGNVYLQRAEMGNADARGQALSCYRDALQVLSAGGTPDAHAQLLTNLGNALRLCGREDAPRARDEAIACYRRALDLREDRGDPIEAAIVRMNLAVALSERIRTSDDQEEAIGLHRDAERALRETDRPLDQARNLNNLGAVYAERLHGNRAENLELAIDCYERALQSVARQAIPRERAETRHNLAAALLERLRGDPRENQERAIGLLNEALDDRPLATSSREWVETHHALGRAFARRLAGERRDNLGQAIGHHQQALEQTDARRWPGLRARIQTSLGDAWLVLGNAEDLDNLDRSVACHRRALKLRQRDVDPRGWAQSQNNLGLTLARLHRLGRPTRIEAIAALENALEIHGLAEMPAEHRISQRNLGDLFFDKGDWGAALTCYRAALDAGECLYAEGAARLTRQPLLRENRDLSARTAYCLACLGRAEAAVLALEQGRTRVLNEALALSDAAVKDADPRLRASFEDGRNRLAALEGQVYRQRESDAETFNRLIARLHDARRDMQDLVERLRRDHPGFLPAAPDLAEIRLAAASFPLVYVAATPAGGIALVLDTHGVPEIIPLDLLDTRPLDAFLFDEPGWTGYLSAAAGSHVARMHDVLERVLPWLQEVLITPLAQALAVRNLERVAILPAGSLAVLPLSAGDWGTVVPHLVPSARLLRIAQERDRGQVETQVRYLGLADADSLPLAAAEVAGAAGAFARAEVIQDATQLRRRASKASHIHLACHGRFDSKRPLESSLILPGGERLSLGELLGGETGLGRPRLVTLSACQSGISEFLHTPDEATGFPAALLQAGASGVVASLWPVDDNATALLMLRFHGHLATGIPPHRALHQAQCWLRESTGEELAQACNDWLESPAKPDPALYRLGRGLREQAGDRPFARPYHWAGFFYIGA